MMRSLICGCLILASVGTGDATEAGACPAGAKDPSCHSSDGEILLQSRARHEDHEEEEEQEQEFIEDQEEDKANATHPFNYKNGVAYAYDLAACHTVNGAKKEDCAKNGWSNSAAAPGYTKVDKTEEACKEAFNFLSGVGGKGKPVTWGGSHNSDWYPPGCSIFIEGPNWNIKRRIVHFNAGIGRIGKQGDCTPNNYALCINKAKAAAAARKTCTSHTCQSGWVKKSGVDDQDADEDTCCEKTCAAFQCTRMGWVKQSGVDTLTSPDDDTCCEETCAAFQCQTGWVKKSGVDDLTSPDDSTCCEETCDAYECQQGKKKEGVGDQTSPDDATCCEEAGLQYAAGRGETVHGKKDAYCYGNGFSGETMHGYQWVTSEDECRKAAESINWAGAANTPNRLDGFSAEFSTFATDWKPQGCSVSSPQTDKGKTKIWDRSAFGGKTNVAYWVTWNTKKPVGKWLGRLSTTHRMCWKQGPPASPGCHDNKCGPCDDNTGPCLPAR